MKRNEAMTTASQILTVLMSDDFVDEVNGAIDAGDYASAGDVVREALQDWKAKRLHQADEISALRADIGKGLDDIALGRVKNFDMDTIIARGRRLLARSQSA
jgi:antitoxin ParD1/3/4